MIDSNKPVDRLTLSVKEASEAMGFSYRFGVDWFAEHGLIKSFGRRKLIVLSELKDYISNMEPDPPHGGEKHDTTSNS